MPPRESSAKGPKLELGSNVAEVPIVLQKYFADRSPQYCFVGKSQAGEARLRDVVTKGGFTRAFGVQRKRRSTSSSRPVLSFLRAVNKGGDEMGSIQCALRHTSAASRSRSEKGSS